MKRFFPLTILVIIIFASALLVGTYSVSAFGQKEAGAYHIQTNADSEYNTTSTLPKVIRKQLKKGKWEKISYPIPPTDIFISMNGKKVRYAVDHQLNIYDIQAEKKLIQLSSKARNQLSKDMNKLHAKHYGQLITWNEANSVLPRYSIFSILDLDTGLSFKVQRRAGSYHADVQPLTNEDTKIMKKIYRGTWSWDRRAILVLTENNQFAASMHGMPHGKGALKNGFPGHFCIHFQDSITHKSRKMDYAHSIMVKKAAGEWIDHTEKLTPPEIVDAAIIAIHQHDWFILASILDDKNRLLLKKHQSYMEDITVIKRLSDLPSDQNFETQLSNPVEVKLYIHREKQGTISKVVNFNINRSSIEEPWTIDLENLVNQL